MLFVISEKNKPLSSKSIAFDSIGQIFDLSLFSILSTIICDVIFILFFFNKSIAGFEQIFAAIPEIILECTIIFAAASPITLSCKMQSLTLDLYLSTHSINGLNPDLSEENIISSSLIKAREYFAKSGFIMIKSI